MDRTGRTTSGQRAETRRNCTHSMMSSGDGNPRGPDARAARHRGSRVAPQLKGGGARARISRWLKEDELAQRDEPAAEERAPTLDETSPSKLLAGNVPKSAMSSPSSLAGFCPFVLRPAGQSALVFVSRACRSRRGKLRNSTSIRNCSGDLERLQ